MIELMGAGYVVDYCISRYKHKQEEKIYRAYIADALMHICNNIANGIGGAILTSVSRPTRAQATTLRWT